MKRVFWILSAAAVIVILSSCQDQETVSISERIDQLESDINNDRSAAFQNVHPDASDFGASRSSGYWDIIFPGASYTFTITSISGNQAFVNVSTLGSSTFTMREDGEDVWKIIQADIPDGSGLEIESVRTFAVPEIPE